ncbi:MAG: hypothetical protein ACE5GC_04000, partial [Acidimicrobiia bacterium]
AWMAIARAFRPSTTFEPPGLISAAVAAMGVAAALFLAFFVDDFGAKLALAGFGVVTAILVSRGVPAFGAGALGIFLVFLGGLVLAVVLGDGSVAFADDGGWKECGSNWRDWIGCDGTDVVVRTSVVGGLSTAFGAAFGTGLGTVVGMFPSPGLGTPFDWLTDELERDPDVPLTEDQKVAIADWIAETLADDPDGSKLDALTTLLDDGAAGAQEPADGAAADDGSTSPDGEDGPPDAGVGAPDEGAPPDGPGDEGDDDRPPGGEPDAPEPPPEPPVEGERGEDKPPVAPTPEPEPVSPDVSGRQPAAPQPGPTGASSDHDGTSDDPAPGAEAPSTDDETQPQPGDEGQHPVDPEETAEWVRGTLTAAKIFGAKAIASLEDLVRGPGPGTAEVPATFVGQSVFATSVNDLQRIDGGVAIRIKGVATLGSDTRISIVAEDGLMVTRVEMLDEGRWVRSPLLEGQVKGFADRINGALATTGRRIASISLGSDAVLRVEAEGRGWQDKRPWG